MKLRNRHSHMIDFLFPVVLFFVFTLSALTVILLAAGIYQSTTEKSTLNDSARTSLSYITEKVHQNDVEDSVRIGSFDNCESLIIKTVHEDQEYCTYIYVYQNELKELFLKNGASAKAADGKTILKVKNFSINELSDKLLQLQCTDMRGQHASIVVGIRVSLE